MADSDSKCETDGNKSEETSQSAVEPEVKKRSKRNIIRVPQRQQNGNGGRYRRDKHGVWREVIEGNFQQSN